MNLVERLECPFCKEKKFNILFKKKFSDIKLNNFIIEYYKSTTLNQILENQIYELCECLNCKGLFQKFIPDDNFSTFLYDKIICADDSLKKKDNYFIENKKKLHEDLSMI